MARVLVGIPTRNRPAYVKEALRSVLAQTVRDIRVIVSDNCSEPEAVREVREFVAGLGDERVRYHLHEIDGGEYGQGRFFASQCEEEFLAMLHDDDRMEPDHLETALAVLDREPGVAFFCNDQCVIDEHGERLQEHTEWYRRFTGRDGFPEGRIENLLEVVLGSGVLSTSGSVIRNEAIRRCGLVDPDLDGLYPFELNVFLRQAENGAVAWWCTRELVGYRWHPGQQRKYEGDWAWNEDQCSRFIKLLDRRRFSGRPERLRRRLLSYACRNHAYIEFVVGRWRHGYRLLAKAVRLYPFRWQVWAYAGFALCFPYLIRGFWAARIKLADD